VSDLDKQMNIPQMMPLYGDLERSLMSDYLASGAFLTEHRKTLELEAALGDFLGIPHVHMAPSGTMALTMAGMALGIGPGDEVIVPAYTMIATANAFSMLGATPVFVDVEPGTLCLDISLVRAAVTSKTRAVVLMSANGRSPSYPVDDLFEFCSAAGLYLIEDAAQSLGSRYPSGGFIGAKSHIACLSFSMPKIITMGQGGALVTTNRELSERIASLRNFGRASSGIDDHDSFGINGKITDMQAVIGLAQLQDLERRVQRKKAIYHLYQEALAECHACELLSNDVNFVAPWFYELMTPRKQELMAVLASHGVSTRQMYRPIPSQSIYDGRGDDYPVAQKIAVQGLWLPSYVQITDAEIAYICKIIRDFHGDKI
jgi:perosamine synthetase